MKIAVWDTYTARADNVVMHFDILVPNSMTDERQIFAFGNEYLDTKPFDTGKLSTKECRFCHIEEASAQLISEVQKKGYAIIEMENCN